MSQNLSQVDLKTLNDLTEWVHYEFWFSYRDFFEENRYTLYELKPDSLGGHYRPVNEPLASEPPIHAFFSRRAAADLETFVPSVHLSGYTRFLLLNHMLFLEPYDVCAGPTEA